MLLSGRIESENNAAIERFMKQSDCYKKISTWAIEIFEKRSDSHKKEYFVLVWLHALK